MDKLVQALQNNNRNDGAGRMTDGEEALIVRAEGRIKTLADVSTIVVDNKNGIPITVGDVAEVKIGALTRYGAVSKNGEGEAVTGLVLSLRGANARQTIAGIEKKLAEISPGFPKGVEAKVFYNRGNLVDKAVDTVLHALLEAIALVVVLLILFLGNLRAALVVALALPLAALFTFILMNYMGMSANLMSLGGLAIAIGMLVDAAVVVVENLITHLAHVEKAQRLPRLHVIYRATREVAAPGYLGNFDYYYRFFTLADPARTGRQTVYPGGLNHCVCAQWIVGVVAHRDSGYRLLFAKRSVP